MQDRSLEYHEASAQLEEAEAWTQGQSLLDKLVRKELGW
jgi:hypothetical protein